MDRALRIIRYPDPRLRKPSVPVEVFDADLKALATRMLELMREAKGVGLAAPQVGINRRLFVMCHSGKSEDDRVYVNPVLSEPEGEDEAEEGCLSLPEINIPVWRSTRLRIQARDLDGNPIDQTESGYIARIWQHETDHLDGILLLDKMTPIQKLSMRRQIRDMEQAFESQRRKPVAR
jgi:peptide deformylase